MLYMFLLKSAIAMFLNVSKHSYFSFFCSDISVLFAYRLCSYHILQSNVLNHDKFTVIGQAELFYSQYFSDICLGFTSDLPLLYVLYCTCVSLSHNCFVLLLRDAKRERNKRNKNIKTGSGRCQEHQMARVNTWKVEWCWSWTISETRRPSQQHYQLQYSAASADPVHRENGDFVEQTTAESLLWGRGRRRPCALCFL